MIFVLNCCRRACFWRENVEFFAVLSANCCPVLVEFCTSFVGVVLCCDVLLKWCYVRVYVCLYMYVCVFVYVNITLSLSLSLSVRMCLFVCVCVCVCVCVLLGHSSGLLRMPFIIVRWDVSGYE